MVVLKCLITTSGLPLQCVGSGSPIVGSGGLLESVVADSIVINWAIILCVVSYFICVRDLTLRSRGPGFEFDLTEVDSVPLSNLQY